MAAGLQKSNFAKYLFGASSRPPNGVLDNLIFLAELFHASMFYVFSTYGVYRFHPSPDSIPSVINSRCRVALHTILSAQGRALVVSIFFTTFWL